MFCAVGGMGAPGAPDLSVEQLLGMQNTYAFQAVQQALASGVCDPASGGGKTGNDLVKVTKKTLKDGTEVYVADPDDLKAIDIGPSAQIPAVSIHLYDSPLILIRLSRMHTSRFWTCAVVLLTTLFLQSLFFLEAKWVNHRYKAIV